MAEASPVDHSALWTYPPERDGWFRAHDALRTDLDSLQRMNDAFAAQLAAGRPLNRMQATAAGRFAACFLRFMHHHHTNEDDIAIPYLATRSQVPGRISADHKQLQGLLDRWQAAVEALLAADSLEQQRALLPPVQAVFGELHSLCLEHFREEEEEVMLLMRKHFTPKEVSRDVVAKIMRTMDGNGVGAFFYPMTREERREFARQEGIPFFVRWILFYQAAKYERHVRRPFEQACLAIQAA